MLKNKLTATLLGGSMAVVGLLAGVATIAGAQTATTAAPATQAVTANTSQAVDTPEANDVADTSISLGGHKDDANDTDGGAANEAAEPAGSADASGQ